jgi:hypothetical protein
MPATAPSKRPPRASQTAQRPRQTPPQVVIAAFGSAGVVARTLGIAHSTPGRWLKAGRISARYHTPLLDASDHLGLGLTPDDLIRGRAPQEG